MSNSIGVVSQLFGKLARGSAVQSVRYLGVHVPEQRAMLLAEGVEVVDECDKSWVVIDRYLWTGSYWI